MTEDQNEEERRRHWQELAEQLGLEPEPAVSPPGPPASAKETGRPAEEPAREAREEECEPAVPAQQIPPRRDFERAEDEGAHAFHEGAHAFEEMEAESERRPDAGEEAAQESPPASKPRRGRRSGQRPDRSSLPAAAAPTSEPAAEQDDDRPRERRRRGRGGRGRGRGRDRDRDENVDRRDDVEAETEEPEPTETAPPAEDSAGNDSDDVDTLSDWNVPSWNELIASLYRPDR